jgi:predicted transcriptional regulator of viral defense system
MDYQQCKKALQQFPIMSIIDIQKRFPDFDSRRLVEWQQKGYILKIRNGFYSFEDSKKDERFLYFTANKIYPPSYVSLESTLAFYNLIPEGVFTLTSVTTRNTTHFETPIGNFAYRHLKTSLFFGYRLLQAEGFTLKMAEAEKVILDYFYLNRINTLEEMEAMRFNMSLVKEIVDFEKMERYLGVFDSKVLTKRIDLFKKMIYALV